MSKQWRVRPSELYCVDDPIAAFKFDRAIWTFGTALTAELDKQEAKTTKETENKRRQVFDKWMGSSASKSQSFRDPANRQV